VYLLLLLYILIRFISFLLESFEIDYSNNISINVRVGVDINNRVETIKVDTTVTVAYIAWKGGYKVQYKLKPFFSCYSSILLWLYLASCPSFKVLNKD
jgi:hypothetical protein